MEDYGITGSNNAVQIVEGGIYEVTYVVNATLNTAGNLVIGVKENDRELQGTSGTITLDEPGIGIVAKNTIVKLLGSSSVYLYIMSTTSTQGGTINQASISLKLLD